MKNKHFKTLALPVMAAIFSVSCSKEVKQDALQQISGSKAQIASTTPGVDSANIALNWSQGLQPIQGFGAFAGRVTPFFESANRDTIMSLLWGSAGLQLNIIRGEILYTSLIHSTNLLVL
ncbi:hypothetical protein CLV59_101766 [Chitinophaga dinghuensis]|uniref:Uncharacterized protein n=1 Tax=Chitinophaga dinghuensis TaxID=1539050 RepID=A0A327WEL2_9BACT|nr:hypothetical protein [Chitinophaga dinghuensis]RAJ88001.1 hypothetical protein CLV59_101766 [Chitinophaga dinghuensis]